MFLVSKRNGNTLHYYSVAAVRELLSQTLPIRSILFNHFDVLKELFTRSNMFNYISAHFEVIFSFQQTKHFQEKRCSNVNYWCAKAIQVFTFPFGFLNESAIPAFEFSLNKVWILRKAILSPESGEKGFMVVQWYGHWSQQRLWMHNHCAAQSSPGFLEWKWRSVEDWI